MNRKEGNKMSIRFSYPKDRSDVEYEAFKIFHYYLGKKACWDILELLVDETDLTEKEIRKKIKTRSISYELRFLVHIKLISRSTDRPGYPFDGNYRYFLAEFREYDPYEKKDMQKKYFSFDYHCKDLEQCSKLIKKLRPPAWNKRKDNIKKN